MGQLAITITMTEPKSTAHEIHTYGGRMPRPETRMMIIRSNRIGWQLELSVLLARAQSPHSRCSSRFHSLPVRLVSVSKLHCRPASPRAPPIERRPPKGKQCDSARLIPFDCIWIIEWHSSLPLVPLSQWQPIVPSARAFVCRRH